MSTIGPTDALASLRPGASWSCLGGVIVWLDQSQTRPTDDEINAEVARLQAAQSAELVREQSFVADASRVDLLTRLKTSTPAQIDTWLTNNVTNLAQARTILGAIIKTIALDARS